MSFSSSFSSPSLSGLSSSASTSSTSSSPLLSHRAEAEVDSDRMERETDVIKTWFAVLNDEERAAALLSLAELPSLREIEPLIQSLKERKRNLWRRQEELLIQPTYKARWAMPVFPRDSEDPNWIGKWLKALRLHKYEKCLAGLSPTQLAQLGDAELEDLGVDTVGARGKLLRAVQNG